MPRVILAGDVGGTKTHLALYPPGGDPRRPTLERKVASRDYPSLEAIASEFVASAGARPTRGVFGIAGPVVGNRCEATNLPWHMDGGTVGLALGGIPVTLLNDLVTTAWGLGVLGPADLEVLQPGQAGPGNRAIIAAGTGLGEALLIWDGGTWHPSASEGGHADFGPRDPLEDRLLQWLRAKYGRASYERVLSGPGLADLYRFHSHEGLGAEPDAARERFASAADPGAAVTEGALDGSCERALLALERFVSIYGAEAGNLALKGLAVGGLFVGGGIAPRILPVLKSGAFTRAFGEKGRLSPLLARIPVSVILDPQTALWGAAVYAAAHTSRSMT